jgi:hypothetical protein
MSIPVDIEALDVEMAARPLCYLLTVSDDGRPHAVAVAATVEAGRLAAEAGRRSRSNAAARPQVSLLLPPVERDGHSLIVDGTARVDGSTVSVAPLRAVLHRAATSPAPAGGGCASDCVELAAD